MRRTLLPIVLLMGILLVMPAATAISVSPSVTFRPSSQMTVFWDSPSTLVNITVQSGAIQFNGYTLAATDFTNITIIRWPQFSTTGYKEFEFRANATSSTDVQYILSILGDEGTTTEWIVLRDGDVLTAGTGQTVSFSNSQWASDVNRVFLIKVNILSEEQVWLVDFGPAWLTLLVSSAFILFIVSAFVRGIRKRRKSGKVWKYMPKRWR